MTRLTAAVVILLCLQPAARATLSSQASSLAARPRLSLEMVTRLALRPLPGSFAPGQREQFVITDQSEVTLDGRRCRYNDVPKGASIQLLELAADNRTILRVHFRTRR